MRLPASPSSPPALIAGLALWCSLSLGCLFSGEDRVAGGGIRTTNGEVAGRIRFADATPAEGARIRLYGVFLSSDGTARQSMRTVVADTGGVYRFSDIPNGRYVLTVTDDQAGTLAIMPRLVKDDAGLAVLDVLLKPTITLRGRLLPPAGGPADPSAYQVCLPGLEACVTPGPDSVYTFPKAPQGECELVFIQGGTANYLTFQATRGESDTVYVKDVVFLPTYAGTRFDFSFYATDLPRSLHVLPKLYPVGQAPAFYAGKAFDDIRYFWLSYMGKIEPWHIEDYMDWTHRRSMPLLTHLLSPSAAPQGLDFPYLVRLDSTFDFSLADPRGLDIRFSSEDNRRLDYHIATWTPAARFAEIWVRLDTLYGSNAPKAVWLHAGRKDVTGSQSFPYTVLNRESGYAPLDMKNLKRAVWYLDEKGATSVLKDQRNVYTTFLRRLDGADPTAAARTAPGIIGGAVRLDGAGDYIDIAPHATLDYPAFSMFLWARNQAGAPAARQFLAAKGTAARRQWQLSVDSQGRLEFTVGDAAGKPARTWKSDGVLNGLDAWHHYAVTFGAGEARLYLDGKEVAATASGTGPQSIPASNGGIALGVNPERTGDFWRGDLDHFTYDSQVRTPDWVRLAYESQQR